MFKLSRIASIAALGALALCGTAHADLVTNGGFETGTFSGWSQFGNTTFNGVAAGFGHLGTNGAFFGPIGSTGGVSQSLSTVAGATYDVSFWLSSDGGVPGSTTFNWDGGAAELSLSNPPAQGMTLYSFALTASSATTDLRFTFRNDPGFYGLDDVSVNARVPEPGTLLLAGLALAGMGAASRRKRAA